MPNVIFRPSKASIWGNCSGSVHQCAGKPDLPNSRTEEGTAAHWVIEHCLQAFKDPEGGAPLCSDWIGQTAPNGIVIDDEMATGAQTCVSDVLGVANHFGVLQSITTEEFLMAPKIHPNNGGTPDVSLHLPERKTLFLWDYKHGHREVQVKGNLQMSNYVAALVEKFGLHDGMLQQEYQVVIRIVQPYCYHGEGPIIEHHCSLADLRGDFNLLASKAHEAMTCPKLSAGAWCRDCPAMLNCPANRKAVFDWYEYLNMPFETEQLTAHDLAVERDLINRWHPVLKARLEAIEDTLTQAVKQGDTSAGLALQSSEGPYKWKSEKSLDDVLTLGALFGLNLQQQKPITVRQALDICPAKMRDAFEKHIEASVFRPAKGLKLVNSDKTMGARAFLKRK